MSTTDTIQLITALCTLAAAIATFITVHEMKRARELSIKPHIIISNSRHRFRMGCVFNENSLIKLLPHYNSSFDGGHVISNLGNGISLDVKVSIIYSKTSIESMIEYINYYSPDVKIKVSGKQVDIRYFDVGGVTFFASEQASVKNSIWDDEDLTNYLHIYNFTHLVSENTPASAGLEKIKLKIHGLILYLYSLSFYLSQQGKAPLNSLKHLMVNGLSFVCKMEYRDVDGLNFVREYNGKISIQEMRMPKIIPVQARNFSGVLNVQLNPILERSISYNSNEVLDNPNYWR